MKNFIFQNPTKLVFGKGQISKLTELIPTDVNLMITFGGGSVKKNGVYKQVTASLEGREYIEFWGIEANPKVETLRKAIVLGKEKNINFLLAVGGGSVLDGTKLVAAGIASGKDAWDIVLSGIAETQIPFASVMTVPRRVPDEWRTVISRMKHKRNIRLVRLPQVSILDRSNLFAEHQIAWIGDAYSRFGQYMTTPNSLE